MQSAAVHPFSDHKCGWLLSVTRFEPDFPEEESFNMGEISSCPSYSGKLTENTWDNMMRDEMSGVVFPDS